MREIKTLNWSDISIDECLEIIEILSQNMSPTEFVLEVGDIFFDIDEEVTDKELKHIKECISFVRTPVPLIENSKGLKVFSKMSMSELIDIDVMLVSHSFTDVIPKVIPKIYDNIEDVLNKPIVDYFKSVQDLIKYRNEVFKKYPNLFDSGDDEEDEYEDYEDEPKKPVGQMWLETIHTICDGDLTRYREVMGLPHLLVLNWFSLSEANKSRQPKKTE